MVSTQYHRPRFFWRICIYLMFRNQNPGGFKIPAKNKKHEGETRRNQPDSNAGKTHTVINTKTRKQGGKKADTKEEPDTIHGPESLFGYEPMHWQQTNAAKTVKPHSTLRSSTNLHSTLHTFYCTSLTRNWRTKYMLRQFHCFTSDFQFWIAACALRQKFA